ncbi:MAG TPA: lipid II flippase MurJ [Salinivirgaceae bacterium]|nr:lipid II flippase MurJ [Salinivirgaceae bacterium]HQA75962.1 lipid II flippase MurJ [Salinivirgaceae bacterium]
MKVLFKKLIENRSLSLQCFLMGRFAGALLVSILLAKSYLWMQNPIDTVGIGQYELFLFIAGFINFFWINALVSGLLSFVDTNNHQSLNNKLAQTFYLFGALSLIFGLLFAFGQYFFIIFDNVGVVILSGALIYSLFWTPSMLLEYTFVLKKQTLPLYLSGFITPLFFLLFSITGAYTTQSVDGVIFGTVLFAFLRFVATSVILFRNGVPKVDLAWIKKLLFFSAPLVISAIIAESGVYIDGIIVNSLFDEQTFAIFRYGARELPLNSILAVGLYNAMIPMFSSTTNSDVELSELKNKTRRLLILLVPISILFLIFSDWLFANVFNEAFKQSAIVFDVYLLLVIPRLLLPQTIIVGFKRNNLLVWVSIIEIITNVALSIWWGIIWGIFGVALATLVAFIVEKVTMIYLTNKHIDIKPSKYIPIKTFTLLSIAITTAFLAKYFLF